MSRSSSGFRGAVTLWSVLLLLLLLLAFLLWRGKRDSVSTLVFSFDLCGRCNANAESVRNEEALYRNYQPSMSINILIKKC